MKITEELESGMTLGDLYNNKKKKNKSDLIGESNFPFFFHSLIYVMSKTFKKVFKKI